MLIELRDPVGVESDTRYAGRSAKKIIVARAYIETSVPSYYVARPSRELAQLAKQQATRDWWDGGCSGFDLVTSLETIDEAGRGERLKSQERLDLIGELSILEVTDAVAELAGELVDFEIVPEKVASDALHIAVASFTKLTTLSHGTSNTSLTLSCEKESENLFLGTDTGCQLCVVQKNYSNTMKTIESTTELTDEVLAEVRRHKREIAKEHGFDVRSIARDLQRRQANHPRLVSPQPTANKRMESNG